jgi:putative SOS response-associated peptidase YedK
MCGRYALYSPKEEIEAHFNAPFKLPEDYAPNWNIAPGSFNPVCLLGKARVSGMAHLRWGLVPSFAKEPNIGFSMINARSETIDEKPSFTKPFQRKRCLIPVNGFYEWKNPEGTKIKIPFYIRLIHTELFAFAGIFDFWKSESGDELFTYSIITTQANPLLEPLHERMPVILEPHQYQNWLDPINNDTDLLKSFLKPYPMNKMRVFRVSDLVNKTANNSSELIAPLV